MKSKLNIMLMAILFVTAGLILTACGKADLLSIGVTSSSFESVYIVGEEPDFSDIVVTATYSDGKKVTLGFDDVTITNIDHTTAGYKNVTVTYEGKTITFRLTYFSSLEDAYTIEGFEAPEFVGFYNTNIAVKQDKQTEFVNRTDGYYVGDDNAFVFLPEISARNAQNQPVTLNRYVSANVVQMKVDGNWVTLETEEEATYPLATYVVVDNEESTFDFTEEAIGNEFRITVRPYFFPEIDPVSFEFKVVDGWNAYNAADLSRLDNAAILNGVNPWIEYKQTNGVGSEAINALILHNDIDITDNDLPASYFWTASEVSAQSLDSSMIGSLKDRNALYVRLNNPGETFTFVGNYFTVDASQISLVKYDDNEGLITVDDGAAVHSTLFSFGGDDYNVPNATDGSDYQIGNAIVKNLNLIGNANRSNDHFLSGGLTFFRTSADHFELNNTITRQVLTILCPLGNWVDGEAVNTVLIKDSKGYDSYSTMFYLWGSPMHFENSEYKNAGGPIMILTHHSANGNPNQYYSTVTAENTVFETLVSGTEAWFAFNGAVDIATSLKSMMMGFDARGAYASATQHVVTSQSGNQLVNLIAVIMGSELTSSVPLKGSFTANLGTTNTTGANLSDPNYLWFLENHPAGELGAPLLQTSSGNLGFYDGTLDPQLNGYRNLNNTTITDPAFFTGDYINIYSGGMGLVLGFNQN